MDILTVTPKLADPIFLVYFKLMCIPHILVDLGHDSMKCSNDLFEMAKADNFRENMCLIKVIPNLRIN